MKPQRKLNILLVEDNHKWKKSLKQMYQDILGRPYVNIESVDNVQDAIDNLEDKKYDLLSLDINLWITAHDRDAGISSRAKIPAADGRYVLRRAVESCKAVIVITGLQQDQEIYKAIPDEEDTRRTRITLDSELNKLFPGKNLIFNKVLDATIEENVQAIKSVLTIKILHDLCAEPENVFHRQGTGGWDVYYRGKSARIKHSKGMIYIAYLLDRPTEKISCALLSRVANKINPSLVNNEEIDESLEVIQDSYYDGLASALNKAERQKAEKLKHLYERRESLSSQGDVSLLEEIQAELDKLVGEINLGPRKRWAGDREKARQAVTKGINRAIKQIELDHKELGQDLRSDINLGFSCEYKPNTNWSIRY